MCGKDLSSTGVSDTKLGSPPRVRERLNYFRFPSAICGITPACAGKTAFDVEPWIDCEDHPRVCGKDRIWSPPSNFCKGSPPRVRERLNPLHLVAAEIRITPACAGKTTYFLQNSF